MNKLEVTELGIRLLAIFNLTTIVSTLPALMAVMDFSIVSNSDFPHNPWMSGFFSIVMPVFISLLLWFKAKTFSKWIWRNSQTVENLETEQSPTVIQFQIALFTAIGLYFLVSSVPDVLRFGVYIGQELAWNSFVGLYDYSFVVGYIIQVAISIWLIFGSNRIVKALHDRQKNRLK